MRVLFFVVPLPGVPVLCLNAENSSRVNERGGRGSNGLKLLSVQSRP